MNIYSENKKFKKYKYAKEADFEADIVSHSSLFFGERTIFIDAKKKIDSKSLGGTIPDGFLFDLSDIGDAQFFLVEVELSGHDFFRHIFPQITKFFAFYKNHEHHKSLCNKLFALITEDPDIKAQFKKFIGEKEIFKFLTDLLANSQNILLIVDGEKKELPEIRDTYADTWGRMVKPMVIQRFDHAEEAVFTMEPEYEVLEYIDEPDTDDPSEISEDFHFEGALEMVKEIYGRIKSAAKEIDETLVFNPQKYYISIRAKKNFCYLKIRKKKILVIVMLPEGEVREIAKHHEVKSLSDSVQGYYNGPCAAVNIVSLDNFSEVAELVRRAHEESQ